MLSDYEGRFGISVLASSVSAIINHRLRILMFSMFLLAIFELQGTYFLRI